MADAVVVSTARTAIGTAFRGSLVDVDAFELGTRAVTEAVRRSGVDPAVIDDVVVGESLYGGGDIARYVAIEAGLDNVPGVAHNRHCAAGLAAVTTAAGTIRAGMDRVVVAFLLSDEASFVTGVDVLVDGGVCAALRGPAGSR